MDLVDRAVLLCYSLGDDDVRVINDVELGLIYGYRFALLRDDVVQNLLLLLQIVVFIAVIPDRAVPHAVHPVVESIVDDEESD